MAYDYNLLEKFANNEKKQKIYTIVFVFVLLLLLAVITYLMIDNIEKKKLIEEKTITTNNSNKSFNLEIADLKNENAYYKSKTNRVDTVLIIDTIFVDAKLSDDKGDDIIKTSEIKNYNLKPKPYIITQIKKGNFIENATVSEQIIKQIKLPTIYIQYCCGNIGTAKDTRILLANTKKYNVPEIENINFAFNSTIKYFHEKDREIAKLLLETLRSNPNKEIKAIFKNVEVEYVKMLAPEGQLEIWIGK